MCSWCEGSGHVFACNKENLCLYAFICGCEAGQRWMNYGYKSLPKWEKKLEQQFVGEYQDKIPLDPEWVIQACEQKKTTEPEFQHRLSIWGRERFEKIWERSKEKK